MKYLIITVSLLLSHLTYAQQTLIIAATSDDAYDTIVTREVVKQAGYIPELKVAPWARCLAMIKNGDADVLGNVYLKEERKQFMHYSEEAVFNFKQFLYVKKSKEFSFDGDIYSLAPYKIGTRIGFSYGSEFDKAAKNKALQIRPLSDTHKNMKKLIAGRVDMIIENPMNLSSDLEFVGEKNLLKQVKLAKPAINSELSYIVTSRKAPEGKQLIHKLNNALLALKASGRLEKIMLQDFGFTEGYQ